MGIFNSLIPTAPNSRREAIAAILRELPAGVVEALGDAACTIRPIAKRERYVSVSPALKHRMRGLLRPLASSSCKSALSISGHGAA